MIEDPIKIKGPDDWANLAKDKIGKIFFYECITSDDISFSINLVVPYLDKDSVICNNRIFSINNNLIFDRSFLCSIQDEVLDKKIFLETLNKNYPDYLIWLLFHPEWLR